MATMMSERPLMSDEMELLIELHVDGERQGPGGEQETMRALELSGLSGQRGLTIADLGCGTGASTLVLASALDAHLHAVELSQAFLERLDARATARGLRDRLTLHAASMDALPFQEGSLDAIWSEGAIYNLGFERGLQQWRRYLKPGGVVAASELTWLTAARPAALDAHWRSQYAEVGSASAKLEIIERCGYSPLGYFVLPARCWLDGYYRPMQQRIPAFLAAHPHDEVAQRLVDAELREIDLYERYSEYFGYGFYIARRVDL
jgi:SAM-dependent methyltransferase